MVATALPALDWFSGRPACPRRPHCPRCPTHNTHTHNHTIAATAAVSAPGGAAGTQRSSGAEGDWRRRVRRVQRICGFGRAFAGLTDLAAAGSSSVARRAVRRAAVDMSTATTTAACTRARAARALYTLQQGPRSTKRAPSTAIEFQRARLRVGKTAFTSTTMWRMFAARTGGPRALARSRRRARAAATSRVTGPVLAASSTSEMHCRSQWSRSGLSECNHVAVDGHHLMPV